MNSAFDSAFEKCDAGLKAAFGCSVNLWVGGQLAAVTAEVERDPSLERFSAARGKGAVSQRMNEQVMITFLQKDVPADYSRVRVELDGKMWRLTDPVAVDGDLSFLLVQEIDGEKAGDAGKAFINFT